MPRNRQKPVSPKQNNYETTKIERYFLSDQTYKKNAFIIYFEEAEIQNEDLDSYKINSPAAFFSNRQRLTLAVNESKALVQTEKLECVYSTPEYVRDSIRASFHGELRSEEVYGIRSVITGSGTHIEIEDCINGIKGDISLEIPSEHADDKSFWVRLMQKCNETLLNQPESGPVPIELVMQHIEEIFGTISKVETNYSEKKLVMSYCSWRAPGKKWWMADDNSATTNSTATVEIPRKLLKM